MEELRYTLALLSVRGIGSAKARHLIETFGSAKAVFEADASTLMRLPRLGDVLLEAQKDTRLMDRADRELEFIAAHHIKAMTYGSADYPKRLAECQDAPTVLFQLGKSVTESRHVLAIVGTRQCTKYGRDMTQRLVSELHERVPDVVIVSGLALGIDVTAHQAALQCGAPTVGVMAHGLDRIYPYQHREVARQMIANGGSIVTEYLTATEPEKGNFLARNRIIAGLADAVLVSESKDRGGSLVTASIALDYCRDVFAFPGRVGDDRSTGCNRLIRLNRAGLVTCADELIEQMGWQETGHGVAAIQHSIPFEEENLPANGRLVMDALRDRGDMTLAQLADVTGLDHASLLEVMLDLEMDGKIWNTPGGEYRRR